MNKKSATLRNPAETRRKLIEAAVGLMLRQGYGATSVDGICEAAGVTKGSFFHHFESKEAIALAGVEWWGRMGTELYAEAWRDDRADPLDQLRAMLEIMISFTGRPGMPCVCMVGMMSQELAQTTPAVREACARELQVWTGNVARLLTAAKVKHRPAVDFDPEAAAWFLNSLWQGSMLIGKTRGNQSMIAGNVRMARSWVDSLFKAPAKAPRTAKRKARAMH